MRIARMVAAALSGLCLLAPLAHADDAYPTRPVRIIVPFAPAGSTDVVARMLAERLTERLGQPFVVENRAGASGNVGAVTAARSRPDGYTLLFTTSYLTLNAAMTRNPGYDPVRDFSPISIALFAPMLLVARGDSQISTTQDLLNQARANPGRLEYASSGARGPNHAAGELMNSVARVNIVHVPFNGAAPGLTAVVGGHVALAVTTLVSAQPLLQSGQLKSIALFSNRRLAALPDVPTFQEAGLQGLDVGTFFALLAPAGTPEPIVQRLYRAMNEAMRTPQMQRSAAELGAEVIANTPAEFASYIRTDLDRWTRLARDVPELRGD